MLRTLGRFEAEHRRAEDEEAAESLSPAQKQSLVDLAMGHLASGSGSEAESEPSDRVASLDAARARRGGWRVWAPALAASVALVAGAWWLSTSSPPTKPSNGGPAATSGLPAYVVDFRSGDQAMRGADDGGAEALRTFSAGSRVDLVLRPETTPDTSLDALAWRAPSDTGPLEPWAVRLESSDGGAFRLVGARDTLFPKGAATWTTVFVLGPRSALPRHTALSPERLASMDGSSELRVLRVQLRTE